MEQIELAVSPRAVIGKQVSNLRRNGLMPAVLYGRHLDEPVLLQIETRVFSRVLTRAGTSRLITLNIQGQSAPQLALVREVQREPITGSFYHVDFLAVSMTDKIRLKVPVVVVGEPLPVTRNEGIILQAMNEIEIECLPADLVESVRVDVSKLNQVGMEIKVGDLTQVLTGVQVLADPNDLIVRITPVREEKIEEAAGQAAEVEVISKGKAEEEEAEG